MRLVDVPVLGSAYFDILDDAFDYMKYKESTYINLTDYLTLEFKLESVGVTLYIPEEKIKLCILTIYKGEHGYRYLEHGRYNYGVRIFQYSDNYGVFTSRSKPNKITPFLSEKLYYIFSQLHNYLNEKTACTID